MKKLTLLAFIILIKTITSGQTVAVTGTVNDQKGQPVAFAFVYDSQHPYATYTDSNGSFILNADPTSNLLVKANNYTKTAVKISNPSDMKIVLADNPNNAPGAVANKNQFEQHKTLAESQTTTSGQLGGEQEDVHGRRFIFEKGVHGFIIAANDSIKQNDDYLFNIDKINGSLLISLAGKTPDEAIKGEIKQFTLFDDDGQRYVFENAPNIDAKFYLQVLASGTKYKIYKKLTAKYITANFTTNGMTSSGNRYDEYVNDSLYYAVKLPGGQPQKFELKKKSIKAAFASDLTDTGKVNKFISDTDMDIDDKYIKKLGEYFNQ